MDMPRWTCWWRPRTVRRARAWCRAGAAWRPPGPGLSTPSSAPRAGRRGPDTASTSWTLRCMKATRSSDSDSSGTEGAMVFTVQRGQNARQGRGGRRAMEPGGGDTWRGGGDQDPGRVMGCSARCTHWHPQYLYFYILACPVSRLDLLLYKPSQRDQNICQKE